MKRYVKPSVLAEKVEVTCGICAGSPAIDDSNGNS